MRRLLLSLLLVAACVGLIVPAAARADGDPGSDVLVYQNLYVAADDGVSNTQELALTRLLYATTALKAPVRVAIIGRQADLGTVTSIWTKPTDFYADYLGTELSAAYGGRLIVVEPKGVAFSWMAHHQLDSFPHLVPGSSPAGLIAAATMAVKAVEQASGVSAARLVAEARSPTLLTEAERAAGHGTQAAVASTSAAGSTAGREPPATTSATDVSPVIVVLGLLVMLGAVFWVPPLWRRRRVVVAHGMAVPGLGLAVCALAALAVLAIVVHSDNPSSGQNAAETLAQNPDIATPTSLGDEQPAANFTLTDEAGNPISLRQYRGKVVILAFTDAECQTICPLTTQAMVDARDSLGAARKDVVLLGVNANQDSTSVEDVASYTELHGLLGQWHFLTGSQNQLVKVWKAYHVYADLHSNSRLIEHTPAVYMIGPDGKVRYSFLTYSSYAAIPQFGQVLAQTASKILPSHPRVSTTFSYGQIDGIAPSRSTSIPWVGGARVGGGRVPVGSGRHVYFFFDSWDEQSTDIRAEMPRLDAYETYARAHGLPTLIGVDEGAVEPNPAAVTNFLSGMRLNYPVGVDTNGRLADGYGVEGEPWFVLTLPRAHDSAADPTAAEPWEQEVYTQGLPSIASMETSIPAALRPAHPISSSAQLRRDLAGSPPKLVVLHGQADEILGGGSAALAQRLRALRGTPVVVNVWASSCGACQAEFGFLAAESAQYGAHVAFLGIDYDDISPAAAAGFLARHHVYYPSYAVSDGSVPSSVLPGGVAGTPTTIYFNAKGVRTQIHTGTYISAQQLGSDIQQYAIGAAR